MFTGPHPQVYPTIDTYAYVGRSGPGKTTLMNEIAKQESGKQASHVPIPFRSTEFTVYMDISFLEDEDERANFVDITALLDEEERDKEILNKMVDEIKKRPPYYDFFTYLGKPSSQCLQHVTTSHRLGQRYHQEPIKQKKKSGKTYLK